MEQSVCESAGLYDSGFASTVNAQRFTRSMLFFCTNVCTACLGRTVL